MALKDAVATVLNRNAFYRDGYRLLLRLSLLQSAVIVLLIAAIVSLMFSIQTRHVYFATTSDGRIINIVPLGEPYRSSADVITWAAQKARTVMQFDYSDFRDRLQDASADFTPTGWDSFTKALKEANVIEAVQARKLVVSLAVDAAPEITDSRVENGVYTWYLRFPVTIKFDGDQPPSPIGATLLLQIVRVSTLQNPDGISIQQWVVVNTGNQ
ncbi:MAG TPA: DotI/IcmL/TraM family protein [Alphaproteobacteria bacterium]|nr:DotI/IcmL/TraM family protein [Alphaproteobacteria bacterium]